MQFALTRREGHAANTSGGGVCGVKCEHELCVSAHASGSSSSSSSASSSSAVKMSVINNVLDPAFAKRHAADILCGPVDLSGKLPSRVVFSVSCETSDCVSSPFSSVPALSHEC